MSCSTHAGANTFTAQSWTFGTEQGTGTAAGRPLISGLTLLKPMDECSTSLFGMSVRGDHIRAATLTVTDATGRTTLMTVALEGMTISSYHVSGTASSPAPGESVVLGFSKITISYFGSSGVTKFGFDLAAMKSI